MTNRSDIFISEEVDPARLSGQNAQIFPGCRIYGAGTFVGEGAVIGEEAPVTLVNCQVGPQVRLKGGYFKDAVFLKGAVMGSGAHVREGTILEEAAGGAHSVGLKQTILFPHVMLGSLINFCDCLMAGGTDRNNHSEVGSAYIHFNFTPNQDKATASLIGDVPAGVMLDQPPIFLGGQGGLVGPAKIAYGTVIAAGSIFRKDVLRPGRLISEAAGRGINVPHTPGLYRNIKRVVHHNITYIANLLALEQWYRHVRPLFVSPDFPEALRDGLIEKIEMGISERFKRVRGLAEKMPVSMDIHRALLKERASAVLLAQKQALHERCGQVEQVMRNQETSAPPSRDVFLSALVSAMGAGKKDYLSVIKSLPGDVRRMGTQWLQSIVTDRCDRALALLPEF